MNYNKISLSAAIKIMETPITNGALNVFSVMHAYSDPQRLGKWHLRKNCCRHDPSDARYFDAIDIQPSAHIAKQKKIYDRYDKRVIIIFDMDEARYKSIKIDLLMKINDLIIDHLLEV